MSYRAVRPHPSLAGNGTHDLVAHELTHQAMLESMENILTSPGRLKCPLSWETDNHPLVLH